MRIIQAAYACIMRETKVLYNKMIEGVVSVWRERDGRFGACTSEKYDAVGVESPCSIYYVTPLI